MNRQTLQNVLTCTLLLCATTTLAGSPTSVPTPALSFDCAAQALPSQRAVGELTGQANFSQTYATRTRLMGEVKRACLRKGTTRVVVVPSRETSGARLAQKSPAR